MEGRRETETERFIFRGDTVQQPFVAGRGEKFAFFVIFFLPALTPLPPLSPFPGFVVLRIFFLYISRQRQHTVVATLLEYRNRGLRRDT